MQISENDIPRGRRRRSGRRGKIGGVGGGGFGGIGARRYAAMLTASVRGRRRCCGVVVAALSRRCSSFNVRAYVFPRFFVNFYFPRHLNPNGSTNEQNDVVA